MSQLNIITIIIACIQFFAVILNILKIKWCWLIWIPTSIVWLYIGYKQQMYGLIIIHITNIVLVIIGFIKWNKEEK